MHMATEDERDRLTRRMTFPVHVQASQILWIEAQLDAHLSDQSADTLRIPVLQRRVAAMSQKEPENVAKLLRTWMRDVKER